MRRIYQWLVLGLVLASCSMPAVSADVSRGMAVYSGTCAACHSANPLNNIYGILSGANSPATIEYFIANAYPMQSLSNLATSDIDAVAAYLGSLVTPVAVVPQTGYWWNSFEPGRGYVIEQNSTSGNVFFGTYLYAANGNPVWYTAGPAPMSGNTFSAPMAAFSNGQTLTGTYQPPAPGTSPGSVSITFSDVSHGLMTWPGGMIPIQRFEYTPGGLSSPPTATQPQTGYWWDPAEAGRGYVIEVQFNILFIAACMYDSSGNPVWYAAGPATLVGNAYQGTWILFSGGQTLTGAYQAPAGATTAGNLAIQFASPTTGTLTLPDGRQIPIQRFAF